MLTQRSRGFTLIEVMVTVAIVAILAAVALPAYSAYVQRSRVPPAFDGLSSYATRMEQRYQDTGCYAGACSPVGASCGVAVPVVANFTITCTLSNSGQGFTATATGTAALTGYTFTINNAGTRVTTAHPRGANAGCWTSKGGSQCDS
jgi:type IV pilus assembly protein PilE